MFEYISAKETAEKWGISERRIQKLCEENRIDGVVRFGHAWAIPKNAEKPKMDEEKKIKMCVCNILRTFTCYTFGNLGRNEYETNFDCRG